MEQLCPSFPYTIDTACSGAHGGGIGAAAATNPCLNGGLCEPEYDGSYVLEINAFQGTVGNGFGYV